MTTAITPCRARALIVLDEDQRRHRCDLVRWALRAGRPLTLDSATVIIAVRASEAARAGTTLHRWTTADITTFIWGSAVGWCAARDVRVPAELAESLWTYLAFLGDRGLLSSGSSPLPDLLAAIAESAALDRDGRCVRVRRGAPWAEVTGLRRTGTDGAS